jgi:phosphonate transport system permease protein
MSVVDTTTLGRQLREDAARVAAKRPAALKPDRAARLRVAAVVVIAAAVYAIGLAGFGFSLERLAGGLWRLADITLMMLPPTPETWARFGLYTSALGETLAIAFLGTLFAALIAAPLSLLAARNVVANWLLRLLSRRFLDTLRGIDTLIWALIWINVVGLGPFAGVLAIMSSDIGSLGKLFSEAIETADKRAVEGVVSTGGSHAATVRFGIIPQVLPVIASQCLYYFESNTRSATVIGIVGAGGIGMHLTEQIRTLEWNRVSFIILMVLAVVALIDWISGHLRQAIIGARAR